MKKKFYYFFPLVILAVFSVVYWQFSKASDAAEADRLAKTTAAKIADEAKKKEDEAKSREDSQKRTAARLADEQAKENERIAKWEADTKSLEEENTQYVKQIAKSTGESASLEKQLAELRATKEKRTRDLLDTATDAELSAIAKRNAELEILRMTEMIARKTAGTSLLKS